MCHDHETMFQFVRNCHHFYVMISEYLCDATMLHGKMAMIWICFCIKIVMDKKCKKSTNSHVVYNRPTLSTAFSPATAHWIFMANPLHKLPWCKIHCPLDSQPNENCYGGGIEQKPHQHISRCPSRRPCPCSRTGSCPRSPIHPASIVGTSTPLNTWPWRRWQDWLPP